MICFEFPIYEFAALHELRLAARENSATRRLTTRRSEYKDAIKLKICRIIAYLAAYMRVAS